MLSSSVFSGCSFDSFFGSWDNAKDHYYHGSKLGYDWQWYREGKKEPYFAGNGTYDTFLITDHTNKLLREHFGNRKTAKEPIFIYTAYLAPHKPAMVRYQFMQLTGFASSLYRLYCLTARFGGSTTKLN